MMVSAMPTSMIDMYRTRPQSAELTDTAAAKQQTGEAGAMPPVQKAGYEKDGNGISGDSKDGSSQGCETCRNRKYQDGSDDPGVSFKTPSKISPRSVASAVRSHEMEHVFREQFKAAQENRQVIYQSVTLHNGVCPECGKTYVSGGTTRTVTKGQQEAQLFQVGLPDSKDAGSAFSSEV